MSVAHEVAPEVFIPERARRGVQTGPARDGVRDRRSARVLHLTVVGAPVSLYVGDAGAQRAGLQEPRVVSPRDARALVTPGRTPRRTTPDRVAAPLTPLLPGRRLAEASTPPAVLALEEVRCASHAHVGPVVSSRSVRVTARGRLVMAAAAVGLAVALLWVAHLSAGAAPVPRPAVAGTVVVQPGDTLWSIARSIAPHNDPRATVDELMSANHLVSADVQVGQVLSLHG